MSKHTAKTLTVGSTIRLTEDIGFIEPSGEFFQYVKNQLGVVLDIGKGKDRTVMVDFGSEHAACLERRDFVVA